MMHDTAKYWFLEVAKTFLHTPYRWGGDDPTGIDCSGLVVECLESCGKISADHTADGLWRKFKTAYEVEKPTAGCLAFWLDANGRAYHVAICLDAWVCLTADGGGSKVLTLQDAVMNNASVKIRPIDHRGVKPKYVNIFSEERGLHKRLVKLLDRQGRFLYRRRRR